LNTNHHQTLHHLFHKWCGEKVRQIQPFPKSGSNREYYRLTSPGHTAIGVYNPDKKENRAFVEMTRFFAGQRIPVPALFGFDPGNDVYLIQDLGDTTLFSLITGGKDSFRDTPGVRERIREALRGLAQIQVVAGREMDFSICHPYRQFGYHSMVYDLNYFREQFLDRLGIDYSQGALVSDFQEMARWIGGADQDYFMYRDFQSRNIMLHNDRLYFIDYQGGRKGPLQYDLAAFLYQARAGLPDQFRQQMVDCYLEVARKLTPIDVREFKKFFYPIALLRVLQTLGAYGLRGLKEQKQHFIRSIPYALNNLKTLYPMVKGIDHYRELNRILQRLMYFKFPYNEPNQ
jgi:aminoglycoside/choline kinase family phosphotransferase